MCEIVTNDLTKVTISTEDNSVTFSVNESVVLTMDSAQTLELSSALMQHGNQAFLNEVEAMTTDILESVGLALEAAGIPAPLVKSAIATSFDAVDNHS